MKRLFLLFALACTASLAQAQDERQRIVEEIANNRASIDSLQQELASLDPYADYAPVKRFFYLGLGGHGNEIRGYNQLLAEADYPTLPAEHGRLGFGYAGSLKANRRIFLQGGMGFYGSENLTDAYDVELEGVQFHFGGGYSVLWDRHSNLTVVPYTGIFWGGSELDIRRNDPSPSSVNGYLADPDAYNVKQVEYREFGWDVGVQVIRRFPQSGLMVGCRLGYTHSISNGWSIGRQDMPASSSSAEEPIGSPDFQTRAMYCTFIFGIGNKAVRKCSDCCD